MPTRIAKAPIIRDHQGSVNKLNKRRVRPNTIKAVDRIVSITIMKWLPVTLCQYSLMLPPFLGKDRVDTLGCDMAGLSLTRLSVGRDTIELLFAVVVDNWGGAQQGGPNMVKAGSFEAPDASTPVHS